MKSRVLLLSYFSLAAFALLAVTDGRPFCDTRWLRYVYRELCGNKKRESVHTVQNLTLFENFPRGFEGPFRYFRMRDLPAPSLGNDEYLNGILREDEKSFRLTAQIPKLSAAQDTSQTQQPEKAEPKTGNYLGIPGFPDQWDINEIVGDKVNENHKRQLSQIIESCCQHSPVTACSDKIILDACP